MRNTYLERLCVRVSQDFQIRLRSIPSSGYVWRLESHPEELQFLGAVYEPSAGAVAAGRPVGQVFTFRATASGSYEVTFVLKRMWQSASVESRKFVVEVSDDQARP